MVLASEAEIHYTWLLPTPMRCMSVSAIAQMENASFLKWLTPQTACFSACTFQMTYDEFFPHGWLWYQVLEGKRILGNIVIAELTHYKTSTNGFHKFLVAKYILDRPNCPRFCNCSYSSDNRSPASSRIMPNLSYRLVVSDLHSDQTE